MVEIAVGVLGVGIASILPRLEGISAGLSSYAVDDRGWHVLSLGSSLGRYVAAGLLIAPSTLLMGATLTILIRFAVAGAVGTRIAVIYGVNTIGAECFVLPSKGPAWNLR